MFGWLFGGGTQKRRVGGSNRTCNKCHARAEKIRRQREQITALKQEVARLKRINKAQQPMANSGVNVGTYRLYVNGIKKIRAITYKRQRLSTYTMPEIRAVCDDLLGASQRSEFHGWNKRGKPIGMPR